MDASHAEALTEARAFRRGRLGDLPESAAEALLTAGSDVALVIDRTGVIRDVSVSGSGLAADGADAWIDRRWTDLVTQECRSKVDQLLREALAGGRPRWREINQLVRGEESVMVRFLAVPTGREGEVVAIGRDGRESEAAQQRLINAQQTLERDYARLRDAEFRYRLLFRMSAEAVVIVDAQTRRVVEANPAAERMIGRGSALNGEPFVRLFSPQSQDGAAALVAVAQSSARPTPMEARLRAGDHEFFVSASLFRQDRAAFLLVRLSPAEGAGEPQFDLRAGLERVPDPFVLTDSDLKIVAANTLFLDLVRVPTVEQAEGQPLARFVGRANVDRNLLLDALRSHGSVRNFATVLRTAFDETEDVELSGVSAPAGETVRYGVTLRPVARRLPPAGGGDLRQSVQQLTELVGRVSLKELVRETTDLVEKLCVEAALELTGNNRASAAELLGLSRQSLYSKLHRFGLSGPQDAE